MNFLSVLAVNVVADLKKDLRQKFEQAITDFVHQRDVFVNFITIMLLQTRVSLGFTL